MRMRIKSPEKHLNLIFPTSILFTRLGMWLLKKRIKDTAGENASKALKCIEGIDIRLLKSTVIRMRKLHKNWKLFEIESADGSSLEIKL